jgi:hypothetical protein
LFKCKTRDRTTYTDNDRVILIMAEIFRSVYVCRSAINGTIEVFSLFVIIFDGSMKREILSVIIMSHSQKAFISIVILVLTFLFLIFLLIPIERYFENQKTSSDLINDSRNLRVQNSLCDRGLPSRIGWGIALNGWYRGFVLKGFGITMAATVYPYGTELMHLFHLALWYRNLHYACFYTSLWQWKPAFCWIQSCLMITECTVM